MQQWNQVDHEAMWICNHTHDLYLFTTVSVAETTLHFAQELLHIGGLLLLTPMKLSYEHLILWEEFRSFYPVTGCILSSFSSQYTST